MPAVSPRICIRCHCQPWRSARSGNVGIWQTRSVSRDAIRAAVADYLATRRRLMEQYRAGTLEPDWDTNEHGVDCTFEHFRTRQVVEAPRWADDGRVDPKYFAIFVKSTVAHAAVAELLESHEAARILDLGA